MKTNQNIVKSKEFRRVTGIKSGKFDVGGKKELAKESKEEKTMIVDAI